MGTVTLSKTNRLYWLGRYVERAYIAISIMEEAYDQSIDGDPFDYVDYCARLDIPSACYQDAADFIKRYLFDALNPDSAATTLDRAFDNAVVLRETIGSQALSYVQMATNVMAQAAHSTAPMLDLQTVRDQLMAFKGCIDGFVYDEENRRITKLGFTVERIDLSLRLEYRPCDLNAHFERLASRLRHTRMPRNAKYVRLLIELTPDPDPLADRDILLECVEHLFPDA